MDKLVLEDGKYEIEYDELNSIWKCKRFGEEWTNINISDLPGGKMFIAMFYEAKEGVGRLSYFYDGFNMALDQIENICLMETDDVEEVVERIHEMKIR